MAPLASHRGWRRCRRIVRWLRIATLLLLLAALCGLLYLNQVGLPDFLKQPVLDELRARGLQVQFSRLRLHWYRGLVAENLQLLRVDEPDSPHFVVREAAVRLDHAELAHLRFRVTGLVLQRGTLTWPLPATNQPPLELRVEQITTRLRFLEPDQWELDQFEAQCLGAKINLQGTLTNASFVSTWHFPGTPASTNIPWLERARTWLTTAGELQFTEPPQLKLNVHGDAREAMSFGGDLLLSLPAATTPWGRVEDLLLVGRLNAVPTNRALADAEVKIRFADLTAASNHFAGGRLTAHWQLALTNPVPTRARWQLELAEAQTPWGNARRVQLEAQSLAYPAAGLVALRGATNATTGADDLNAARLWRTTLEARADELHTARGDAAHGVLSLKFQHAVTNWIPLTAEGSLHLAEVRTEPGRAAAAEVHLRLTPAPADGARGDESWAAWAALAPYALDFSSTLTAVEAPELQVTKLELAGHWRAPGLQLEKLHADLYGHGLNATATLDVASRRVRVETDFDFDVLKLTPLLAPEAQRWLQRFTWATPPRVTAQAAATLPAWTNRAPDWPAEVLPTLTVAGGFTSGPGSFKTIPVEAARAHFFCTNSVWRLPDLAVQRPEGSVELDITHHSLTQKYRIGVRGRAFPQALKPVLGEKTAAQLDRFEFHEPVFAEGEIWGPWTIGHEQSIFGQLTVSNFTFHGESIGDFTGFALYTNSLVVVRDASLHREGREITLPGIGFDLGARLVALTNIQSGFEPVLVARCLGPKTAQTLAPYQFEQPPAITINGVYSLTNDTPTNLRFDVAGGPFRYWKFQTPQISGQVRWEGDRLVITNLAAAFYHGTLAGELHFDFAAPNGAEFGFTAHATNTDLRLLMEDLSPRTNKLEGALTATLRITSASATNWQSWQGAGDVQLRDGLIWDIPAFGMFSPLFNGIAPGLGNSRADQASAHFTITNSVIHTDDLAIHTLGTLLTYQGTIDFQGRLDARAEAQVLRNTWLGPVFRVAFLPLTKLFEYKVTGTLSQPKKEPLYVLPRVLLMPFHPFRSIRDLFPGDTEPAPNPPPTVEPPAPPSLNPPPPQS